ncbi:uncharacterized protein EI97DRAFT_386254 [Westerdykella ornata]|uniref:Ornithine decarboxylase antizyme n=1 Tax=Westerdykella ornata TaxID=318751 RepID=A0A6A6J744_WESOR|nr:uncharacterized protein EI97DRAFT_386254 [Westerdykella ornata]KAF2272232.1 hypothetical protein EI97DRAFT_386254 [Westerdykella ornata]
MANSSTSNNDSSSSNFHGDCYYTSDYGVVSHNVSASCYAVDARTTALQGFHYSTTGAGGVDCVPEQETDCAQGIPSPPQSPPLAARHTYAANKNAMIQGSGRARRGGAAYTITEECERLFCETLRAVFLGEGNAARQDSLVSGMHIIDDVPIPNDISDYGVHVRRYPEKLDQLPPSPEMDAGGLGEGCGIGAVRTWLEMWDYVGGNKFRGFVAEKNGERAMFVFFDQSVIAGDLKAGLMALLELCDNPYFSCSRLVACLDRRTNPLLMEARAKDLGWIGFQLTTLEEFGGGDEITSTRWLFMDMEV